MPEQVQSNNAKKSVKCNRQRGILWGYFLTWGKQKALRIFLIALGIPSRAIRKYSAIYKFMIYFFLYTFT